MTKQGILDAAKHLSIQQNVSIQVLDRKTGQVVQEHTGHNQATNSLLFGIAHHLIGDFMPNEKHGLNPGFSMLSNYVPRYISLGTMGLINQEQDSYGLPAGIGDSFAGSYDDPKYLRLLRAFQQAEADLADAEEALKNECPYYPATDACASCQECSTRIETKRQARDDAKTAYANALDALTEYSEEARFVDYRKHTPGYGADGYNLEDNHDRKYPGLGYAYTSYEVTLSYRAASLHTSADVVTYKGTLYKCIADTPVPAGQFDPSYWEAYPDDAQPFSGKTINMELISNVYPRMDISYRDVVPEGESEIPNTIDIVFSAMISTGALAQFREEGKDYVFITEVGLWSKRTWTNGDENGLLAGYRILPPSKDNWDMTVPENRKILKENILKVGINQVVQVIWKIQIGSIADFIEAGDVPDVPPKYSDVAYIGLQPSYFSSDMAKLIYWHLFTDNLNDPYGQRCPSIPAAFRRSKIKRGNPVPPNISNIDEQLYLDFEMDDNNVTQTVWWWTQSGKMTLTNASNFYYWTYFYNSSTSAFYSIDVSHCYINTDVCNGQYGMTIRPDKGINYVSMDVTNATFGPNGSIAFGSTAGKPLEIIGLDTCVFEQSSGNIFSSAVKIHGDLVMDYVVRNRNIRVGNIYGFDTPNAAAYFRNWIIPSNYSGPFIWILYSQSEPYHIYVDNWVFANCTSLGELVSSNQPYQPVTLHGFETWDVSQMVNLHRLFLRITDIEGTLENWDVSQVTDMGGMFEDTEWNRTSIESIGSWDVSSCMDFSYMFYTANSSHMGYGDYSFLDNWDVNPEANFQYILPYYQWVTKFPSWNGWFNTNAGATFIPYTGTEVERCYFRGIYNNISDLPATASEGDSYYILYAEYNKYFYHNGEWHTTA